jgi:uncharacterized membrane protein YdfJ with MMPL/SSD domain
VLAVLLPAVMAMLGERNWYLPRWLRWLPVSSPGEAETAADATLIPARGVDASVAV